MDELKLYMVLLGCKPKGRFIEQHDMFFGIATSLTELKQEMIDSWPEAEGKMHIDGWREVNNVEGYKVQIQAKTTTKHTDPTQLFFLNLGGYKPDEFEEFHYKMLIAATDKGMAIQRAKQTTFYVHTGFRGANSHIDDQYGVDVDDIYEIEEILTTTAKDKYSIHLIKQENLSADTYHLGYLKMSKL